MAAQDYWKILRPIDGSMALLAVLTGFIVSIGFIGVPQQFILQLALALASVFIISGAGIVLNDFFDAEIDRVNAPNRPIPSGKISKKNALNYSLALFAIGLILASQINAYAFALALINTALEILYAWKLKKSFLIGNFVDSWFPASSFLYGALISMNISTAAWLAALAFFANTGREIFGDLEDIEGDRKAGAKTMPLVIGEKKSRWLGSIFTILAVLLSFLPFYLGLMGLFYLPIVCAADFIFLYSIFQSPSKNQALTKWAMAIAMLAFLAGVL